MVRDRATGPLLRVDPGWLFVVAGAAIVCAMVLLPANERLAQTAHQRDRAQALADHAARRLASHASYLTAVERAEPTVIRALAASELNLIPDSRMALRASNEPTPPVLDQLEPIFDPPDAPLSPDTRLMRLASHSTHRLWAMSFGMLCVLYGLLPSSRPSNAG